MAALQLRCPDCNRILTIPKRPPLKGACPKCGIRFAVNADGRLRALPARDETGDYEPDFAEESGLPWGKIGLIGGIGGAVTLAFIVVVIVLNSGGSTPPSEPPAKGPPGAAPIAGGPIAPAPIVAPGGDFFGKVGDIKAAAVNTAIDRGLAHLRRAPGTMTGEHALTGLTLLSCGAAKDDPVVQDLLFKVRRISTDNTYEISTAIWFLDRFGDPADQALIRELAMRLIAGQRPRGGWDYRVPALTAKQQEEMIQLLNGVVVPEEPPPDPFPSKSKLKFPRPPRPGFGDVKGFPVFQFKEGMRLKEGFAGGRDDNSISQFALLALWRARDYGIPVTRSFAFAEARFRESQAPNGNWTYTWMWPGPAHTDSMTCSGLLALAIARGVKNGADKPASGGDPAIERGLLYLGRRLRELGPAETKPLRPGDTSVSLGADALNDIYFLWSMERVAVIYDLHTIGDTDWYAWGVPYLLRGQRADGSWHAEHSATAHTCFALLFLRRVNVAQDLTTALQDFQVPRDAGKRADGK